MTKLKFAGNISKNIYTMIFLKSYYDILHNILERIYIMPRLLILFSKKTQD